MDIWRIDSPESKALPVVLIAQLVSNVGVEWEQPRTKTNGREKSYVLL